jgi:hypothetical protein
MDRFSVHDLDFPTCHFWHSAWYAECRNDYVQTGGGLDEMLACITYTHEIDPLMRRSWFPADEWNDSVLFPADSTPSHVPWYARSVLLTFFPVIAGTLTVIFTVIFLLLFG